MAWEVRASAAANPCSGPCSSSASKPRSPGSAGRIAVGPWLQLGSCRRAKQLPRREATDTMTWGRTTTPEERTGDCVREVALRGGGFALPRRAISAADGAFPGADGIVNFVGARRA